MTPIVYEDLSEKEKEAVINQLAEQDHTRKLRFCGGVEGLRKAMALVKPKKQRREKYEIITERRLKEAKRKYRKGQITFAELEGVISEMR